MRRWFFILVVLLAGFVMAAPVSEVKMVKTDTIVNGNGVCEFYENDFSRGDSAVLNINGVTLNLELVATATMQRDGYQDNLITWKVNGVESDDLWNALNENGVDFGPSNNYINDNSGVSLAFDEKYGYNPDCLGYSKSTGLVTEIEVDEGWNLVPLYTRLDSCQYAKEGMLCSDDVSMDFFYVPRMKKYFAEEEMEIIGDELEEKYGNNRENMIYDEEYSDLVGYMVDDVNPGLEIASKWIYVNEGVGTKKLVQDFGSYVPFREEHLKSHGDRGLNLFEGWNLVTVDAFMLYDDEWNYDPLSLGEMKGSCNFEGLHMWNSGNQNWEMLGGNSEFSSEDIRKGFLVKTTGDCVLGYANSGGRLPRLPTDASDFPESIGSYTIDGDASPDIDKDCNTIEEDSADVPESFRSYYGTDVCVETLELRYKNGNEGVSISLTEITSGKGFYQAYFDEFGEDASSVAPGVIRLEENGLLWWTGGEFDLVMTQESTKVPIENGFSYDYGKATGNNDVTRWFLKNYPPKNT